MKDYFQQTTLDNPSGFTSLEHIDWTYKNANIRCHTHGIHKYPARMIPQIPDTLFTYFKTNDVIQDGDLVFDPFAGSGTTAVEARRHGLHSELNDINPFACLLTRAKATPLDVGRLQDAVAELKTGLTDELTAIETRYENDELEMGRPDVRDGWFPEPQLYQLAHIRNRIDALEGTAFDRNYTRYLRVALAATTREISYQRDREFKRYRMADSDRSAYDPDVYPRFHSWLEQNSRAMEAYSPNVDHSLRTSVCRADSRTDDRLDDDSVDIVITSPPYGDHPTTVTYGQFSTDPAIIAAEYEFDEMTEVDSLGLGGTERVIEPIEQIRSWSPTLDATLQTLSEKDGRDTDALQFFSDYFAVMQQVNRVLKPGQPVVWVVANRRMSRTHIPTHQITRELCEHIGLDHETTLSRQIQFKTQPSENAPDGTQGKTETTMNHEYLVVLYAT